MISVLVVMLLPLAVLSALLLIDSLDNALDRRE
jgi:hypothetical protein